MATLAAAFACVDFYFQFPTPAGFGPQFVWLDSGVYRRAQGLFYEASTLGNFCVFFLTMAAVAVVKGAAIPRLLLAAGVPLLTGALVLSFSRGSLVALAISLTVLAWMHRRKIAAGKLAAAFLVAAPAAAWLLFKTVPAFVEHYWLRLSLSAEYLFSSTEGVLSGRVSSWRTLVGWMSDHPWQLLTGIGYKTLPYTSHLGQPVVADNMYLSLLVETGIAGLIALLWLNVSVLRASLRASRSANRGRSFLGCWMFCFWTAESIQMLSGDLLTYWRVLPVYFFVLALAVRE
jgi:O-antigen ligase